MSSPYGRARSLGAARKLIAVLVIAAVLLIGVLIYAFNSFTRAEPGTVLLVRNGGAFTARTFQQVVEPADGVAWIGWGSTASEYPTTERFDYVQPGEYGKAPETGDDLTTDRYRTRTKDGQDVGIQGQWRYTVNTDERVLEQFDAKYGTRSYGVPGTDERVRVSDGDQGMAVFIAGQLRSIQQEAMRAGIGSVNGPDLDPSFALLNNLSADPNQLAQATAAAASATNTAGTFTSVSDAISKAAIDGFNAQLGTVMVDGKPQPFLTNIRFTLQQVYPSPETQQRIEGVRSSVAQLAQANAEAAKNVAEANGAAQKAIAEAEGRRLTAEKDAAAQVARQAGYNACSTCAEIDRVAAQGEAQKAANSGWGTPPQVYAPGSTSGFIPVPQR